MDKPKDKKKIKGGKSKKKMKQPKTSDKKTIEALKKQLRIITEKYLNDRKKRTKDPEKFKVDSERIKKKVDNAKSPENISRLISMLSSGKSPSVITAPPQQQQAPSISSTRGTINDRITMDNLSKRYDKLLEKWNNLDYTNEKEVREFYKDFKGFGENMADFGYASYKTLSKGYEIAKGVLGGMKNVVQSIYNTMSSSRPEGTDPPNNPTDAPPAPTEPPPEPTPEPPPPPQTAPPPEPTPAPPPEPTPEQTPTPTPTPPPTTEYLKDTLSSLVNPRLAVAGLAAAGTIGGGLMYRNRNRIRNNNAQVVRQQERLQDIVAPLATGLAERAALRGLGGDLTGLFPPTEGEGELNIESFQSRRNRDRTGLDSRVDIQQNIENTQDSTAQAREFLEENVRLSRERSEQRMERQRVRDERRNREMRRVQDELANPQNFRSRDNLRQLRQEVGIAQQEADINRQLQQQNINEDSIRSPNTREVREEAEEINRLLDDVRDMGEDDAIQRLQENPNIPREAVGRGIGESADMADALDEGVIPDPPMLA
jgi:energy-coupling factor transporter ATP-binding protein EcfA2